MYYEGKAPWTAERRFQTRISHRKLFQDWIPDFAYEVVRLHDYSNEELLARGDEISLIMLFNKIQDAVDISEFLKLPGEKLNDMVRDTPEVILDVIVSVMESLCIKIGATEDETRECVSRVREPDRRRITVKKALKRIVFILIVVLIIFAAYVVYVFKAYYRLPDKLTLEVKRTGENNSFKEDFRVVPGGAYFIMTYNIGFGAYQKDYSFFMDGGKSSWGKDKESVMAAVCGMGDIVSTVNPDFVLLQEVDLDGTRSYHVDELELINQFIKGYYYDIAQDYDSPFLFFPPWEPHGANKSCLVTYSRAEITDTMRRSLPISESFSKLVDLDRCYSISRIPAENGKQLCIYNVHTSAYGGSDEIRQAQLSMLYEDMVSDYKKGNYVICGGDFNHNLKEDGGENAPEWAYPFPRETLPEGFQMAIDGVRGKEDISHNSCRSAETPYDEATTYTVTLDGFIVSDNVRVNYYQNMDWGYELSDHDPVLMQFILD